MNAIETARQLGIALQNEDVYKKLEEAKKANDEDEALQDKIGQFNLKRISLNAELTRDTQDEKLIASLEEESKKLYAEIMDTDSMKNYSAAKDALDSLVMKINAVIEGSLSGEDPMSVSLESNGCTGSCATCGGCH